MRSTTCITAITLYVALALPARLVAANPLPLINLPLVPDAIAWGGAGFTLTVNGTGFVAGAVVNWNGSARATTFVSGSKLTATILAADIAAPHTASVTVVNPSPGGASNAVFFAVTTPGSPISFGGSEFGTGSEPNSVATADFNGDGKLDLAVSNVIANTISILFGNGDGTFQTHVDYPTQQTPDSVVVGDFNGDSKLDVAVRNPGSNTVSVLLGNGDGTFQAAANFAVGSGTVGSRVVAGDFNGDGKLDLAATNYGDNTVSILLGNGDGTFQNQLVYPAGPEASQIAVADLNRDGKLDLVVVNANSNNAVSVLLGNGDGTFRAPIPYSTGSGPSWVNAADLNGDGILDLVVPDNGSNTVSILLGNGDGTFKPHVDYAVTSGALRSDVADLNGDGKLDLAIAPWNSSNVVSILLGNGDGTFGTANTYPTGSAPEDVVAGDFNGDGRMDLVVADNSGSAVSILLQNGALLTASPGSLSFPDQLVGSPSATMNVVLTNGNPTAVTSLSIGIAGPNAGDFAQSNNCGTTLGSITSCTISVTFTPSATGPDAATVNVTSDQGGPSVALNGIGVTSGPNVTLSAASLTFATRLVDTTSAARAVTLGNYGTNALNIAGFNLIGDFGESNTCGTSIASGATCTIRVTFTPTQTGSRSGALSIKDNAPGSPQSVTLKGTGTVVEIAPASLTFATQLVGTTSPGQTVTLTNAGKTALSITGITLSGDFAETNTCGSSLAAGASCTISVTFAPSGPGKRTGNLSITDNGGGSPQKVSLTGTGTVVELNPSGLNFHVLCSNPPFCGSQTQTTTLTKTGTKTIGITNITISGLYFSETENCPSSLGAGQSCSITVTFRPAALGTFSGTVSITDTGGGSPQKVLLSGTVIR